MFCYQKETLVYAAYPIDHSSGYCISDCWPSMQYLYSVFDIYSNLVKKASQTKSNAAVVKQEM